MSSKKSLLILGASASLAKPIIEVATIDNWKIDQTFRQTSYFASTRDGSAFSLDLREIASVNQFLDCSVQANYDGVISFMGATSDLNSSSRYSEIEDYYRTFCTNYFYLLDKLLFEEGRINERGHLLVIGSRASEYGSYDSHYAAVKSALIGFCRSISRRNFAPGVTCLIPSLVVGSKMFNLMSDSIKESHSKRSKNKLMNLKEVADEIWRSFTVIPEYGQARVIEIGPKYF